MTESQFYKEMLQIKRDGEMSTRKLAEESGISHGTLIEFFNVNKPFRLMREETMARINHRLGISFEVMEEYNRLVLEKRNK